MPPIWEPFLPRRAQDLLQDLIVELQEGRTGSTALVVERILKKPNEARRNMYSAVEALPGPQRQPARELIGARPGAQRPRSLCRNW